MPPSWRARPLGAASGKRAAGDDESMFGTESALVSVEAACYGGCAEALLLAYPNSYRQSRCANYVAGGGCV